MTSATCPPTRNLSIIGTTRGGSSREILPLSSLRFIAAALVVVDHLQMFRGFEFINHAFDQKLGAIGVSVFFVLSGYILSYTYLDKDWRYSSRTASRDFFIGRFARIFPLHWLTFLIALPLGLNSNTSRVSVSDFPLLLTLTDRFWPLYKAGPQPVKAAWTLSCESLFYILTPLLFFLLCRTDRKVRMVGIWTIAYTLLISVLASQLPNLNWLAYLRVPEFLLGIFIFVYCRNHPPLRFGNPLVVLGAVLLFAAGLVSPGRVPAFFVPYLTGLGAAILIVGCAYCSGGMRRILSLPRFVLLGHASYALYLMHDPALRYLKFFMHRTGADAVPTTSVPLALLCVAGIIGASVVCYRYYETPCRKWIRARSMSEAPVTLQSS